MINYIYFILKLYSIVYKYNNTTEVYFFKTTLFYWIKVILSYTKIYFVPDQIKSRQMQGGQTTAGGWRKGLNGSLVDEGTTMWNNNRKRE